MSTSTRTNQYSTKVNFTGVSVRDVGTTFALDELNAIKTKELLEVAKTLEKLHTKWMKLGGKSVVRRHFDMSVWCEKGPKIKECGTIGCAIGSFIEFNKNAAKKLGLSLETYDDEDEDGTINFSISDNEGRSDFNAIRSSFNITEETAHYLFYNGNYPKSKQKDPLYVAERIKTYVAAVNRQIKLIEELEKIDEVSESIQF